MSDFLEIDEKKKTIKKLNLDDLSIENLNLYILERQQNLNKQRMDQSKIEALISIF